MGLTAAVFFTLSGHCTEKSIPAENWSIVLRAEKSASMKFAVKELQELLAVRIGKKLPLVAPEKVAAGKPVIVLEKFDKSLAPEEFRIYRKGNEIRIAGSAPLGTLWGIYEFLQRYCDVWSIAPGVTYAPRGKALSFGSMDLRMKPYIAKREVYHEGFYYRVRDVKKLWDSFDLRNRVSPSRHRFKLFYPYADSRYIVSPTTGKGCHNFYDYVPPAKYGKTHPEYFSVNRSGVRDMRPNAGGQLCLSNKDVEEIVYRHLMESIRKDRAADPVHYPRTYDFSQLDNTNYICLCSECKKIIARYGNTDSGLMIWFVNKVARRVKKVYSDVFIRTFAYVSTEHLPKGIKAEDNVLIQLCDLYSKSNHMYPLTHPVNRNRKVLTEGWGKVARNLMIWDYILQSGSQPVVPFDAIAEDVRFFRKCNVKWIFMESEVRPGNPASFEILKDFVLAQLYFNPDQDLEKLIDVYCRGYFGAAHREMKQYLTMLRNAQKKHVTTDMVQWHLRQLQHLSIDFLRSCRKMILKAESLNRDPVIAVRILAERNVVENALITALAPYPKLRSEQAALQKNQLENRLKVLKSSGLIPSRYKKVAEDVRRPIEESKLVFTDIPEELKKLPPGTIRFLGSTRSTSGGHNGKRVKDPDSKMPSVIVWRNADVRKFGKTMDCGVYDRQWKRAKGTFLTAPADEKYHWYKVVRFLMGPSTVFYAQDWHAGFNLQGFYIVSDGVSEEENPNMYDLWVSIKFQGPAYRKGSTKENGIYFERAMLVPVSAKLGNNRISEGKSYTKQF